MARVSVADDLPPAVVEEFRIRARHELSRRQLSQEGSESTGPEVGPDAMGCRYEISVRRTSGISRSVRVW